MSTARIAKLLSALVLALPAIQLGGGAIRAGEIELSFAPAGPSQQSGLQIPARLLKPDGRGPFPAIVIMHDCSGLGPRSSGAPGRWAQLLLDQGYAVMIPDSFTPRGLPGGVCTAPRENAREANGQIRAGDAYGALAMLRAQPDIDPKRIGIMGGSHGGWTTLSTMSAPAGANDPLGSVKRGGFAAGVALYPNCAAPFGSWSTRRASGTLGPVVAYSGVYKPVAPLIILIGEADDWTPAEHCRHLVEASRAQGHPVDIMVYPGAHHSFDSNNRVVHVPARNNANSPTGKGATTGGDPGAWADARARVVEFFARHVKQAP